MSNYEFISNVLTRSTMLLSPNVVFDVALESCCCSENRAVNFPSPWPSSSRVTAVSLSFPERLSGHLLHHEEVRQTSRPQPGHKRGRRGMQPSALIHHSSHMGPGGQHVLDLKHLMRPGWDRGLEASFHVWAEFSRLWGNEHTGLLEECPQRLWLLLWPGLNFFNLQTGLEYMCTVIYIQAVHEKLWLFILNSD